MEFYDVIRRRRSIRGYKPEAIPEEKLDRIREAIQLAPTACNLQPFRFLLSLISHTTRIENKNVSIRLA